MKVGGDATRGSHTDYQQLFTAVILQQTSPSAAHLQVSVHAAGACEAGSAWRLAGVCVAHSALSHAEAVPTLMAWAWFPHELVFWASSRGSLCLLRGYRCLAITKADVPGCWLNCNSAGRQCSRRCIQPARELAGLLAKRSPSGAVEGRNRYSSPAGCAIRVCCCCVEGVSVLAGPLAAAAVTGIAASHAGDTRAAAAQH
jgi:hypothetical protein